MKKYFYIILAQLIGVNSAFAETSLSGEATGNIRKQSDAFRGKSGYDEASYNSVSNIIALLIKVFLGFLGIIFIILIIFAGYNWMTAGGNEEKISKAKTGISRAIIGLIIIVSAYAITYFVFAALDNSTSAGPAGSSI